MILDTLANSAAYECIHPGFAAAFAFLRSPLAASLEPKASGSEDSLRHEINGDRVFALIQRYQTKSPADTFWEAHRRHIDVQFVVEGVELMGHAPRASMREVQPYDEAKEYVKLEPRAGSEAADRVVNFVRVTAGMFAVFMPADAHMPSLIADDAAAAVKKIVVKVRVER